MPYFILHRTGWYTLESEARSVNAASDVFPLVGKG